MNGTVKYLNRDDAMVAIETGDGAYTVAGMMEDYEIEVGDSISGPLNADGAVELTNDSKGTPMTAYIEDTGASEEFARTHVG